MVMERMEGRKMTDEKKWKVSIKDHYGDCSIHAAGCDICDCGAFRRMMTEIDRTDNDTREALLKHQCQVREFAERGGAK